MKVSNDTGGAEIVASWGVLAPAIEVRIRYPPVLRYLSTQVLDLETILHFSNTKFSPFSNVYIGDMSLSKLSHDECYFNI